MADNSDILDLMAPKPILPTISIGDLPENPTVGDMVYNPDDCTISVYTGGSGLTYVGSTVDTCVYDHEPKKIVYGELECNKCGAVMETSGEDKVKCPYCGTMYYNKDKYVMGD
jgi:hypothetical protein